MGKKEPSAEQVDHLIELWNRLVSETKRGLPANPKAVKVRRVAKQLIQVSPGRETFEARCRILLSEHFREPAYTSLKTLWSSWESLGAKQKATLAGQDLGAGQPPTPTQDIRRIWASPKPPQEAFEPIRKWLERH